MQLALALEARDRPCWIAPRDIEAGASYPHEIVEGIKRCPTFLILLSDAAAESPHILRELEMAVSQKKRIIPLRLPGVKLGNAMEYLIASLQWIEVDPEELRTQPGRIAERILEGSGARLAGKSSRGGSSKVIVGGLLVIVAASVGAWIFLKKMPPAKVRQEKVQVRIVDVPSQKAPEPKSEIPKAIPVEVVKDVPSFPAGKWSCTIKSGYLIVWEMMLEPENGIISGSGFKQRVNNEAANFTERKTTLSLSGSIIGKQWKGTYVEQSVKKQTDGSFEVTFSDDLKSFSGSLFTPSGKASAEFFGNVSGK